MADPEPTPSTTAPLSMNDRHALEALVDITSVIAERRGIVVAFTRTVGETLVVHIEVARLASDGGVGDAAPKERLADTCPACGRAGTVRSVGGLDRLCVACDHAFTA